MFGSDTHGDEQGCQEEANTWLLWVLRKLFFAPEGLAEPADVWDWPSFGHDSVHQEPNNRLEQEPRCAGLATLGMPLHTTTQTADFYSRA